MKETLRDLGINIGLLVAGFAGSLVLVKQDGHKSWFGTITSLLAGTLSANYLTPVAVSSAGLENSSSQYAVAFILGFLGLRGVEYVMGKLGFGPK
jgi:hypothetical protein